ncbi:MAG: hypothetical protein RL748_3188, partial [Pseudomonadota bacterium]
MPTPVQKALVFFTQTALLTQLTLTSNPLLAQTKPVVDTNTAQTTPPPLSAKFVSQSVPVSIEVGKSFVASISFSNSGSNIWNTTEYGLAAQNP